MERKTPSAGINTLIAVILSTLLWLTIHGDELMALDAWEGAQAVFRSLIWYVELEVNDPEIVPGV